MHDPERIYAGNKADMLEVTKTVIELLWGIRVPFEYRHTALQLGNMPLVAMHWEHRFNHMVKRYNEIFREQMPNITPHVCRHTYCSIQARAGMYPKTLQYLMGHSDIGVTMNTYTHLGLEDALEEVGRMQELENARKEQEKLAGKKEETKVSKRMFRVG